MHMNISPVMYHKQAIKLISECLHVGSQMSYCTGNQAGGYGPAWSKPELVVKYLIRMALLVFDTMIV